jgi:DNA-directed RNA polymerase specialized sigma24 family protein
MLGSIDQAEEALQETLLGVAWRGLSGYQGRAPLHHRLHKIATMACLRAVERRERLPAVHAEIAHLQPYPDALIDELDPALVAERRCSAHWGRGRVDSCSRTAAPPSCCTPSGSSRPGRRSWPRGSPAG